MAKLEGLWWMTDNLAFNYKLPIVNGGKVSVGTDILNLVQSGYYNITFTVTPETPKEVTMNKTFTEQSKVFLWTYDVDENDKGIIGLEDLSGYKFTSFSKEMSLPIRCVQGEWIDLRDDDNDGVLNEFDKCPDTEEDLAVDADGCPVEVTLYQ
jgi:hypothetical protein